MSETIETTSIRSVSVQTHEPLVSFSDILSGIGSLVVGTVALAGKVAVGVTKGAITTANFAATKIEKHMESVSLRAVERIVREKATAAEALAALTRHGALHIAQKDTELMQRRISKICTFNDKAGALTLARDLVRTQQARIHSSLIEITAESLRAIGFTPLKIDGAKGLVSGRRQGTNQVLSLEVRDDKDGGIKGFFDSDGFHGQGCRDALVALQGEMRARGAIFDVETRQTKQSQRGAGDGNRMNLGQGS